MPTEKPEWIAFSKLVKKDTNFLPCPICGGEVMQKRFGGIFPLACDPECQNCGHRFAAHKKFKLFKGFKILAPKKNFQPAQQNV